MKWGRKSGSGVSIYQVFPVHWFSKLKQLGEKTKLRPAKYKRDSLYDGSDSSSLHARSYSSCKFLDEFRPNSLSRHSTIHKDFRGGNEWRLNELEEEFKDQKKVFLEDRSSTVDESGIMLGSSWLDSEKWLEFQLSSTGSRRLSVKVDRQESDCNEASRKFSDIIKSARKNSDSSKKYYDEKSRSVDGNQKQTKPKMRSTEFVNGKLNRRSKSQHEQNVDGITDRTNTKPEFPSSRVGNKTGTIDRKSLIPQEKMCGIPMSDLTSERNIQADENLGNGSVLPVTGKTEQVNRKKHKPPHSRNESVREVAGLIPKNPCEKDFEESIIDRRISINSDQKTKVTEPETPDLTPEKRIAAVENSSERSTSSRKIEKTDKYLSDAFSLYSRRTDQRKSKGNESLKCEIPLKDQTRPSFELQRRKIRRRRKLKLNSPRSTLNLRSSKISDKPAKYRNHVDLGLERFAVEKCSYHPFEDFRNSMVEMISVRKIQRPEDLERLLACYLSLNSDEYHDVIIRVFRQVWFELNGGDSQNRFWVI